MSCNLNVINCNIWTTYRIWLKPNLCMAMAKENETFIQTGKCAKAKEKNPNIPTWGTCWNNVINSDEILHLCEKEIK